MQHGIGPIDYAIIGIYFVFVIGVGVLLKKRMVSSEDFFLAGHRIPSWVTGLAFLSANLGAIEVMGMAANAAQYGIMTAHFYWLGAIPAMVFLAIFMMPFYYGSKVRSVPEYLKMRFNEPTRALNAISFAVMTVLMSGINLYAMALVFQLLLGWDMTASIFVSAAVVLAYTALGGLTSSIYNEVLQFFLIVFGLLPVSIIGLMQFDGWTGLVSKFKDPAFAHLWLHAGTSANPMGVDWIGLVSGLGFVLSFGYWCTDFLVIQRALAAEDLPAAQRTPLIAAFPKVFFPLLTVLPGLLALVIIPGLGSNDTTLRWDMALPLMLMKYYPTGMLGIGLTAMLASFMSGMAGNVTAFNTVWTYDLYQSYIAKDKTDAHYLWMGRVATAVGILISIGTAYLCMGFPSIMDYMQLIFSFFNAPLFATFLLGMFWKRASPWGAFWGLVLGTCTSAVHFYFTNIGTIHFTSVMAGNFWRSTIAWSVCFIATIAISLFTKPKPESELVGLCWGTTPNPEPVVLAWHKNPKVLGVIVLVLTVFCNIYFW
ncbi:MAG: sodium:solute symporter family protein [Candidatus Melainabacteria bacterium]|nr:sodium:solute symporter family protein [Candidatus Melainabacteria bacterium]